MDKKTLLCKYHMNGVCRLGSRCQYSHDTKDKPAMVCKFYLQGSCSYGSSCRYDHVKTNFRDNRSKYPSIPKPVTSVGGALTSSTNGNQLGNKMVKLTKRKPKNCCTFKSPENWAEAPEFVPGQSYRGLSCGAGGAATVVGHSHKPLSEGLNPLQSYSQVAQIGLEVVDELTDEEAANMLCPFAAMGHCQFEKCSYLHGLECELCGRECLHPFNLEQRQEHERDCLKQHEKNMEYSFAVQRSEGVSCGICLEVVLARENPSERRFGVLSDCTHSFCLSCIRKWRNSSHTGRKIVRACPICRVPSGFVTPSEVWVEDQDEKEKIINGYKTALWSKPCKYFAHGEGTCPFSASCFYKHAYPDGRIDESQLRRYQTAEGETKVIKSCKLWDFVQARDDRSTGAQGDDLLGDFL